KSRFNRALFETPRSGNLPPLTLPVYEPLLDPAVLAAAVGNNQIIERRSFLRNVVSGDTFLNINIFGIDPNRDPQVSTFAMARGRFLQSDDGGVAILDRATAQALGVDLGGTFPVRKAEETICNSQSSGFWTSLNCVRLRRVQSRRQHSNLILTSSQVARLSVCRPAETSLVAQA